MIKGYCDNTNCEQPEKKQTLLTISLRKEFIEKNKSGKCFWCKRCFARDADMVEFAIAE